MEKHKRKDGVGEHLLQIYITLVSSNFPRLGCLIPNSNTFLQEQAFLTATLVKTRDALTGWYKYWCFKIRLFGNLSQTVGGWVGLREEARTNCYGWKRGPALGSL